MPPSSTATAPVVYVLALDDSLPESLLGHVHGHLLDRLKQKAELKKAETTAHALDLLNEPATPQAILVTDTGVLKKKNNQVSQKLFDYARDGGIVVLGCVFSSTARPSDLRNFFRKWDLPWEKSEYLRTIVALNSTANGVPSTGLPAWYSQKAVFLAPVDPEAVWYRPTGTSVRDSAVFGADSVSTSHTAVAYTKVGNGSLGYIGDVNGEDETTDVVLGMMRLLL